jgi:serine/threonine-protein kinase
VEFGTYRLIDRIGAGGMAEIFLALAPPTEGRPSQLVLKRILPAFSDDEQFVKMFVEEARLCQHLRHPNIVQVFDLGAIDAQYFIAMEYVEGRDLLKTLAACARKKIGFPTELALYIVMEVLKGLDYAHNLRSPDGQHLGIIHRDVSPSNVLLGFAGGVKIADFGIAKAATREKTATGILKGKFGYMAPEQVVGA